MGVCRICFLSGRAGFCLLTADRSVEYRASNGRTRTITAEYGLMIDRMDGRENGADSQAMPGSAESGGESPDGASGARTAQQMDK